MTSSFKYLFFFVLIHSLSSAFGTHDGDSSKSLNLSSWAFEVLNIPSLDLAVKEEIIVAVVDDGFLLSHNSLEGFIYTNENEIPGNGIDDDKNGYIDDYRGWDISDNDKDVGINKSTESSHYHGTFIASLISRIISESFGDIINSKIRILPVKVLSDHAQTTAIIDGYQGIKYASAMNADIICTAWSGGIPSAEEKAILNEALQKNILIIGSAGNTNQETVDFPASTTGIYAAAALDTLFRKVTDSNYGMQVDFAFPGENVRAAHPTAKNAYFYGRGTSAAAGLAVGCASVLKSIKPSSNPSEIIEALKNTAMPLDSINNSYCGKLGSGLPNLSLAVSYLLEPDEQSTFFHPKRSEGTININSKNKRNKWSINPWGAYHSISIIPGKIKGKDEQKKVSLFAGETLLYQKTLTELKGGVQIPGSKASIVFPTNRKKHLPSELKLNYYVETIDSTTLYCNETVFIEENEGIITDNSSEANYANNCSCKWIITVPESKQIEFRFSEFDTEAKVDFVWLFDGNSTNPENIIAKFSGDKIPPAIISRSNEVTVWFVTDNKTTGTGWKLHYKGQ